MLSGPVFYLLPLFFPFSSSSILGIGIGETQTVVILRTTVGMVVVGDYRSWFYHVFLSRLPSHLQTYRPSEALGYERIYTGRCAASALFLVFGCFLSLCL
ncbi:hypothetical protein B0T09DRAFT_165803 [Sordaria sp. MPI-SDFR-AT-0083]|nr:hypothetical protein B0T09DRAFT_165803 [Sordaria sp. MPI-SDFR-AT-0083]